MWRPQASYGTVLLSAEQTKHNRQIYYGHSENQMFSVEIRNQCYQNVFTDFHFDRHRPTTVFSGSRD